MCEFFEASEWHCPLESHLCTSLALHPISLGALYWLPLPWLYPTGVERAPFGTTPAGGEGMAPGGMIANKPWGDHGAGDQGAPEASVPLVGEPKTAENDAEFDIGEIWPVLHLSNRTPFV